MLNNLKLGSTTSTTQLTPADTNIQANWTLPQINNTDSGYYYDTPHLYSLISSESSYDVSKPNSQETDITSQNFAGNYYNWCAATAGGTASGGSNTCTPYNAMPSDATNDICPVNWRLPTGGSSGEFAWLNAKMNNPSATSSSTSSGTGYYQNWQFTGPFRGVFAGNRDGSSWVGQGGYEIFWSSSHYPGDSDNAFFLVSGSAGYVNPDNWNYRYFGLSVRCLLQ
jgi:uncharacterized protein (TIGR02145 family)